MMKIKRVYDPPSPGDGRRILVDRLWPRGIKKENIRVDAWLKDIAPSNELRKWYGHDPSKWEEFKRRYAGELKEKTELIENLRKEDGKGTVTFLFSSKELKLNNAAALREIVGRR